jgi:hypothetical protein
MGFSLCRLKASDYFLLSIELRLGMRGHRIRLPAAGLRSRGRIDEGRGIASAHEVKLVTHYIRLHHPKTFIAKTLRQPEDVDWGRGIDQV